MTNQHEWPTAPIIKATWVPLLIDWTATIGTWTRGSDGNYYNTSKDKVARKGEGRFTNVTEYWPLTATPPVKLTWHVGDTISQSDDLRALPTGTVLKVEHNPFAGKILHKVGPCELEVAGLRGSTYPEVLQYPVTILWLPEETA